MKRKTRALKNKGKTAMIQQQNNSPSIKCIVMANGKGGVGKSTVAALIIDWLNHKRIPVHIIDSDPNQTLQTWSLYCQKEGRPVASKTADVIVIDTAGTSGSCFSWLQKADLIVCPFKANFSDVDLAASWFPSLHPHLQSRFVFVPNMMGSASEQKNSVEDISHLVTETGQGTVLSHCGLKNRDAIYPEVLKGLAKNFFEMGYRFRESQKESQKMILAVMERLGATNHRMDIL